MTTMNDDAAYRGTALHVAEFLSTFQAYFRSNDLERKGPISVKMIEQAIEYRQKLLEHYKLENKLAMLQKDGITTEKLLQELEDSVEASKTAIESTPATTKSIHELLRRFEVWSTKALANHVLMHCVKENDRVALCCSPLLNIPGAIHFLPPVNANDGDRIMEHVLGLSMPANAWMWEEQLRMCNMVSLLQDPEQAMKSTLTAASSCLVGQRKEELHLTEGHKLTPADLVALWMRAQRNTFGLLHFLHLFSVEEAPEESGEERYITASRTSRGKTLRSVNDDDSDEYDENVGEPEPRYIAKFVGSHKKTRKHVLKCSALLDKLVDWAVTNQALFTYKYIRENMPERLGFKTSPKKRPRPADDNTEKAGAKRRKKNDVCESEKDEKELLHACEQYVLRWFGRRNKKVTAILYSSRLNEMDLYPYNALVDQLQEHNVPKKVKKILKNMDSKNSNRVFCRVDRRIGAGNFDEHEGDGNRTFRAAVVNILKALARCTPSDILPKSEVLAASADFEYLHDTYLCGKSATEAAKLLLDAPVDFDGNPTEVLGCFMEPWQEHCSVCQDNFADEGKTEFMVCGNCNKAIHISCDNGDFCDARELMKEYGALAQLDAAFPDDLKPDSTEYTRIWRCSSCQQAPPSRTKENRIFMEAKWCKALIREAGMESFTLPFHDEGDDKSDAPHVSLRRLDAMMDYVAVEHDPSLKEQERQQKLNSMRSPFLSPPLADSSPSPSEQLQWVTEAMLQNPMELLCKGVELMIVPPDPASDPWKVERTAFYRWFVPRFCSWFLRSREEGYPMQPFGSLSHALVARPPWSEDSCIVCRARSPEQGSEEATATVCDDEGCQHLYYSESIGGKGEDSVEGGTSCSSEACLNYDELSSLVGSPLLVLPGDDMLQLVAKELKSSIDHMDRPMIFIVASYLPRQFGSSDKFAGKLDDEGVFHVFPVIHQNQLKFLLEKLTNRRPPETYVDNDGWTKLNAVDLPGVVRMTADELHRRLEETTAIRNAMDVALEDVVRTATTAKLSEPSTSTPRESDCRGMVGKYSSLIESLLRSQTPLVREMVGSLCQASEDEEKVDLFDVEIVANDVGNSDDDRVVDALDNIEAINELDGTQALTIHNRANLQADALPKDNMEPLPVGAFAPHTNVANGMQPNGPPRPAQPLVRPPPFAPMSPAVQNPPTQPPVAPGVLQQAANRPRRPPATLPAFEQVANQQQQSPIVRQDQRNPNVDPQAPAENFITQNDLYRPGIAIWTRIETAFYLEACRRSLPNLALRLLCPRYSLDLSREQLPKLFGCDLSQIPKVQEELWKNIIRFDWQRAQHETGEFVLEDRSSDELFTYQLPVAPLPLDRLTESWLRVEIERQARSNVVDLTDNSGDVSRIRGGGPSDEGLFEAQPDRDEVNDAMQVDGEQAQEDRVQANANEAAAGVQPEMVNERVVLVDVPRNEWNGKLVYIRVATTVMGQGREECVAIGVVRETGRENEDGTVPVSLFFFSNAGYLPETVSQALPASQLFVVDEESHEYRIAREWGGFGMLQQQLPRRVSPDGQMQADNGEANMNESHGRLGETETMELSEGDDATAPPEIPLERCENVQNEAESTTNETGPPSASIDAGGEERERGNGPESNKSNAESAVLLNSIPKKSWVSQIVCSKCQTTAEGAEEEATMIGVVESIADDDQDDMVTVSVFFVSNHGYFPDAASQMLSASSFHIVQKGSEEYELARKWDGFKKLTVRQQSESSYDSVQDVPDTSWDDTLVEGASKRLVRSLCQRQQGPAPIGQLPDCRAVLWIQSDPDSLYVRTDGRESVTTNNDSYQCPWGCRTRDGDSRRFESDRALKDHLCAQHDFGELDSNTIEIEGTGRLFRIPAGQTIVTLSSQLAKAICFELPELSYLTGISRDENFRLESVLDLSTNGRDSVQEKVAGALQRHEKAQSLLRLWSKIARLFAVESTGLFRLTQDECETLVYIGSKEWPSRQVGCADADPTGGSQCLCLTMDRNAAALEDSSNCRLCGLRFDCATRLGTQSITKDDTEALEVGGSSCGLLSLLCQPPHTASGRSPSRSGSGPEGVARSMLIRLAESVPQQLRRLDSPSSLDVPMWDCGGNYQSWRFLVERSHSVGSFLQAYVVLVHSLNTKQLPNWWTGSHQGWTSAFATMSSVSYGYPALFIRLYALDLAIAESVLPKRAILEDTAPLALRRMSSVEERLQKVHEWAKMMKWPRYEKPHNSECAVCNDGGRLLVCEYCEASQHPSCCFPKIVDDSKFESWVCPKCVNDIAVAAGEDDEDD